jgi:ubiquinone/menaquinone biosynthesis C-methylase UbiE
VVGGEHLDKVEPLVAKLNVEVSILIPTFLPPLELAYEKGRGDEFFKAHRKYCVSCGLGNLDGVDSDSIDVLMISTPNTVQLISLLNQCARVVKHKGKVVIFTDSILTKDVLRKNKLATVTHHANENIYSGAVSKIRK